MAPKRTLRGPCRGDATKGTFVLAKIRREARAFLDTKTVGKKDHDTFISANSPRACYELCTMLLISKAFSQAICGATHAIKALEDNSLTESA
jgi:hypothetical protein